MNLTDELRKLVELRQAGHLTEQEFADAKRRVIGDESRAKPTAPLSNAVEELFKAEAKVKLAKLNPPARNPICIDSSFVTHLLSAIEKVQRHRFLDLKIARYKDAWFQIMDDDECFSINMGYPFQDVLEVVLGDSLKMVNANWETTDGELGIHVTYNVPRQEVAKIPRFIFCVITNVHKIPIGTHASWIVDG